LALVYFSFPQRKNYFYVFMTSFAIWINSSICIVFYFHKLSSDTGGGTYWAKNIYLQSTAHLS